LEGEDEVAAVGVVAVFAEEDTLPGAEAEAAAGDGDGEATVGERSLDVGRHVVGAFDGVVVGEVFGGDGVEGPMEVARDVGIGVLVEGEGRRRVQDEDVEQARADGLELGQGVENLAGDGMDAGSVGG